MTDMKVVYGIGKIQKRSGLMIRESDSTGCFNDAMCMCSRCQNKRFGHDYLTANNTEETKNTDGLWTLISPDGREYKADKPLKCCRAEQIERIPAKEQLENLHHALYGICDLCQDEFVERENTYVLAKDTPAEIGPLCETCRNEILKDTIWLSCKRRTMRTDEQIKLKSEEIISEINAIKNDYNEKDSFSVFMRKSIKIAELTGKLDMLIWMTKEVE